VLERKPERERHSERSRWGEPVAQRRFLRQLQRLTSGVRGTGYGNAQHSGSGSHRELRRQWIWMVGRNALGKRGTHQYWHIGDAGRRQGALGGNADQQQDDDAVQWTAVLRQWHAEQSGGGSAGCAIGWVLSSRGKQCRQ